jgi:hypothetical protein
MRFTPLTRRTAQDTDRADQRPLDVTGRPMRDIIAAPGRTLDARAPERWINHAASYVASLPPK